jgi:hypothetical protein
MVVKQQLHFRKGDSMPKLVRDNKEMWIREFSSLVLDCEFSKAAILLDSYRTKHANTAPIEVKNLAISTLLKVCSGEQLFEVAKSFTELNSATAKEIGIYILPKFYRENRNFVEQKILLIGDDLNWEVREWAASALEIIICEDYEIVLQFISSLVKHASPNLRRLSAVAIGYSSRCTNNEVFQTLLKLLEELLEDENPYVRRSLSPFAIGTYAIAYKTEITCNWLLNLLKHNNDDVIWNIGLILTTAEGAKHIKELFPIIVYMIRDHEENSKNKLLRKIILNLRSRNSIEFTNLIRDASQNIQEEVNKFL